MKIGFFTDAYLPQLNGVATSVEAWAKELGKLGHEVYVIAPKYQNFKDKSDKIIRLPSLKIMDKPDIRLGFPISAKSVKKIYKLKLDVVHATSGGSISALGLIFAKAKRIPYVFTYYTRFNHYTHYFLKGKVINSEMMERASRIFCNRCNYIVVPAPKIKNELISFGVKKPIAVIPSGVDINKFKKQQKGYLRDKIGVKNGKILLSVGRLGKEKSVDFLLKTFKIIHDGDPTVNLVLVGDGPEKNNLKRLASKLGIAKNVYFTGLIDSSEINKVYADAEIFVFASTTETQGMVILEALASGLPVVAVKDAVYDGIIKDKVNGILVSKDAKRFAKACLDILGDPRSRKKLSDAAVKSMQDFSLLKTAQSFEKLYNKLIYGVRS